MEATIVYWGYIRSMDPDPYSTTHGGGGIRETRGLGVSSGFRA